MHTRFLEQHSSKTLLKPVMLATGTVCIEIDAKHIIQFIFNVNTFPLCLEIYINFLPF